MQIHIPPGVDALIRKKAAAAGFGDQVDAYIIQLITSDAFEDYGAPDEVRIAGKSRQEVDAMIDAGFASGDGSPMTDDDWRQLHARIDQRRQTAQADAP